MVIRFCAERRPIIRQPKGETAAVAGDTLYIDLTAMNIDDAVNKVQAEPEAGLIRGTSEAMVGLENSLLLLDRNTWPLIGDIETDAFTSSLDPDLNGTAWCRILDGIVDQVQ
jgi:hypothetical protein